MASLPDSSTAPTLDATPGSLASSPNAAHHCVEFVEGSSPQISSETASLLRTRLRAAAGVLFLGFGAFFLWRTMNPSSMGGLHALTYFAHLGVTAVLGASFFMLCRTCAIPLKVLRGYELVIFGMPGAEFLIDQYHGLKVSALDGSLHSALPYWMGLIFTYAMFIPNTWRRAAAVIGMMCVLPLSLTTLMYFSDPVFAAVLQEDRLFAIDMIIMLCISFLSATYGTHVINTLREEAFEAKQLGQYRLVHLIGSGGMGEVYLAEHQMMKRPVAIKLIRPSKAADRQALARFEREVRATAKLSHWNSIEIFDYGRTEDGTFYYVMEYLPGLSLADLVDQHGPLPPARTIHLLTQTCDALSEAHGRGLIHRDLKPGNIFSAYRGGFHDVAKLLDFGLAKPISANSVPVQLTQDGSITGSPMYMSPEQALGDSEPDERCDVYSLGAVAYYLLTGRPPFEGDRAIKIILAHAHEAVVPPSQHRSDIPADLEAVVMRCLAKNPLDRYASAAALREALSECEAADRWTAGDAAKWWQAHGQADSHAEALAASAI
ncbi:MAG: serine/threonine protein kinase [Planctomycetota bacterium]|nr:MAG: serine/threonine protein kinase [Planctomycetota bacterium]